MPQYEFESARWCRSMAKAYHARKDFDTASTFRTVADEIDNLRAELAALKEAERLIVAFNEKLEENPYLSFELGYTRATDWMVHIRDNRGMRNKKIVCTQHPDMAEACREAVAALAALVGEE